MRLSWVERRRRADRPSRPFGWSIVCVDKSILTYDTMVKRVWARSHERTCVYGAIGSYGKQLFRHYLGLKARSLLGFLKLVRRKFGRSLLIMDGASGTGRSARRYIFSHQNTKYP